ncbi:MAG: GAF domain-containing sensor histidine kinase [Chloroflexi bacterium]|nr:GAF domain-containing sensor histidine kinase [Chloroflexota bacterium]
MAARLNRDGGLTPKALRWLTVVVPVAFLVAVDVLRDTILPGLTESAVGHVIVLAVVAIATYLFSRTVFGAIDRMQAQILEQNQELTSVGATAQRQAAQLRALHEAELALASDLALEPMLVRIVELARQLVGARYGALAILDERGTISHFLTSGLTDAEYAALGEPPRGRGLLGAVPAEGQPIRVAQMQHDPRSVGFPPKHPPMTSFLGVPILSKGRMLGSIYLTDKTRGEAVVEFSADDEELLRLFALQAATALDNARLHAAVESLAAMAERERIARELHDSLAQSLGYIRLRAASGLQALTSDDPVGASAALSDVGEAASEAQADVREAILGLRSRLGADRDLTGALREYLERYRLQTGLAVGLDLDDGAPSARLSPMAEVQLLRIIQEALANVRKHSGASEARVRLELVEGPGTGLRAIVSDNGRGFDPTRLPGGAHFGLATMRERADAVRGSLRVESEPGAGTRVIAELPLETTMTRPM